MKKYKRLAIFAAYDSKGEINDYVIYYLKEVKKVCDIIFVSDNSFSKQELKKIENLTIHNICKRHGEYDFGSYKRGFLWAEEQNILKDYDSLTFCNDSVFGPFKSLEKTYNKFENKKCDFWGLLYNKSMSDWCKSIGIYKKDHIQSWFICFKKHVFQDKVFEKFIKNIKKLKDKNDIIKKYEVGLSQTLYKKGFKSSFLCEDNDMINKIKTSGFLKKTYFDNKDPGFQFIYKSFKKNNLIPKAYNKDLILNYIKKYYPNFFYKTPNFPKRLAIFAGYDSKGIINDYVIHYLKELKKVCDIIFVYDNSFSKQELKKIENLTIHNICKRHGEYDFGSYKRGFLWAEEQNILKDYDSLTFCNDSVFGPFKPLKPIYQNFEKDNCDLWGMFFMRQAKGHNMKTGCLAKIENPKIRSFKKNFLTKNRKRKYLFNSYLQSYFVVLKKHLFTSYMFSEFIRNIKKESKKENIFYNGELKLTTLFTTSGFKASYLYEGNTYVSGGNCTLKFIEKGFPFLKKTLFNPKSYEHCSDLIFYKDTLKKIKYPVANVTKYLNNTFNKKELSDYLLKTYHLPRKHWKSIYINKNVYLISIKKTSRKNIKKTSLKFFGITIASKHKYKTIGKSDFYILGIKIYKKRKRLS